MTTSQFAFLYNLVISDEGIFVGFFCWNGLVWMHAAKSWIQIVKSFYDYNNIYDGRYFNY